MVPEIVIAEGSLDKSDGSKSEYKILYGWNLELSQKCDIEWNACLLKLFNHINENIKEEDLDEVLQSLQIEDKHWNWFNKTIQLRGENYKWFYLIADEKIQASCVIYQPRKSFIDQENIFYIEFIASAPWNRNNKIWNREYKGTGTTLINTVLKYSNKELNLRLGFSLHSLPKAREYYEKLGMINYPENDKDTLTYYEISEEKANYLLEVDNGK